MTTDEIKAIEEAAEKATPGPWVWTNDKYRGISLHTPDRGWLIVMDFVRQGMNGAQPRFATWEGTERGRMGGIMKKAEHLDLAYHPDAAYISLANPQAIKSLCARLREAENKINFTYCAYCGHEVRMDADASIISDHIRTCEKHPMREVESANRELRECLGDAVAILKEMRVVLHQNTHLISAVERAEKLLKGKP